MSRCDLFGYLFATSCFLSTIEPQVFLQFFLQLEVNKIKSRWKASKVLIKVYFSGESIVRINEFAVVWKSWKNKQFRLRSNDHAHTQERTRARITVIPKNRYLLLCNDDCSNKDNLTANDVDYVKRRRHAASVLNRYQRSISNSRDTWLTISVNGKFHIDFINRSIFVGSISICY